MNETDSESIIEFITKNVKILDLIDKYKLKARKENETRYSMVCPFHDEDTPSLKIYADTNSYFCYGCGAGSNSLDFIRRYEKIKFVDILERYANKIDLNSYESLSQKLDDTLQKKEVDIKDFAMICKYNLAISLREYLQEHTDKEELVDSCFYEMDQYFNDNDLTKEKIFYIIEQINNRMQ